MTIASLPIPVQLDASKADVVDRSARAEGAAAAVEHLGIDDLRDLMKAVSETAQRLQSTHIALHERVGCLQHELAEANAALRRSQALAALGEVAAGIAHEIRNPLGSIQLYVQMLAEDLADRPAQAELCGKIDRAVVGLDAIVRDVLAFARNMNLRPEWIEARTLFERALASCDALLAGASVDASIDTEPGLKLKCDAALLVQALSNLIRNAVEAMQESGAHWRPELELSAARRRVRCPDGRLTPRVVLAVQDNGPGIPDAVRDRIFNPFFTTRATGTGLGLAIVHRIVDGHGGHVNIAEVRSRGARVELCLPRHAASGSPSSSAAVAEEGRGAASLSQSSPSNLSIPPTHLERGA